MTPAWWCCVRVCVIVYFRSLILFVSLAGSNSDYCFLIKVPIFGTTVYLKRKDEDRNFKLTKHSCYVEESAGSKPDLSILDEDVRKVTTTVSSGYINSLSP